MTAFLHGTMIFVTSSYDFTGEEKNWFVWKLQYENEDEWREDKGQEKAFIHENKRIAKIKCMTKIYAQKEITRKRKADI